MKSYSEAEVLAIVRLEASRLGLRLWRNNVGATYTEKGAFIRYGLANDSKNINEIIKSADLIGIRPILIKPEHVGLVIGQFVSREIKPTGWKYRGSEREVAQMEWANLIITLGGDAAIVTGEGSF